MVKPKETPPKSKHRLSPAYILFHLLFSPDTWRVFLGTVIAVILTPIILPVDRTGMGRYVIFIMLVVLVWALSSVPAKWIAARLQQMLTPKA